MKYRFCNYLGAAKATDQEIVSIEKIVFSEERMRHRAWSHTGKQGQSGGRGGVGRMGARDFIVPFTAGRQLGRVNRLKTG